MKRTVTIILLGMFILPNALPQRAIFLNSGEQLEMSKYRMRRAYVEYNTLYGLKEFVDYDQIHFIVDRKDVLIPRQFGARTGFKAGGLIMNYRQIDPESSCTIGMLDAIENTNFSGATIGSGVSAFFFPIGLVGSAIIASTPPRDHNLNIPYNAPLDDREYIHCYRESARQTKKKQAWMGALGGVSLASLVIAIAMAASL